jgi:hypothetical protein
VVQTTGHRSGAVRRVPVLGFRCGDTIVAGTVRDHSHWIRNIANEPRIGVWVAGRERATVGAVIRLPRGAVTILRLVNE